MRTELAEVGARVVDSYPFSANGTEDQAHLLAKSEVDGLFGYLGAINPTRLRYVLDAGMAFLPVTFANHFDGGRAVAQLEALGIPQGTTTFLDVENVWPTPLNSNTLVMSSDLLIARIDAWAEAIDHAGYEPGLYPGSPQPLTSDQLWKLKVRRYWDALSEERDVNGDLARPRCGFCVSQMYPSRVWRDTGVLVDVNMIGEDFLKRLPTWVVG
jgi:hypothetical protein